jgi:hypothetical protein
MVGCKFLVAELDGVIPSGPSKNQKLAKIQFSMEWLEK